MKNAIFIPSKGRFNCFVTAKWIYPSVKSLLEQGIPVFVSVEEYEFNFYKERFPEFVYIVLPEQNRGLAYARSWGIKFLFNMDFLKIYTLDDDIDCFYSCHVPDTSPVRLKTPEDIVQGFLEIFPLLDQAGVITFPVAAFAKGGAGSGLDFGKAGVSFFGLNLESMEKVDFWGIPGLDFGEDRILQLGLYLRGVDMAIDRNHCYSKVFPKEGGMNEGEESWQKNTGLFKASTESLRELYPWISDAIGINEETGSTRFNWKKMRKLREDFLKVPDSGKLLPK